MTSIPFDHKMNANGIFQTRNCNICGGKTFSLHSRRLSISNKSSWEAESTMKILGIVDVDCQLRICPSCFHIYRHPLFDESRVYGEAPALIRKQTFERYNPGEIYGGSDDKIINLDFILTKASRVFQNLSIVLSKIGPLKSQLDPDRTIRILDWGGEMDTSLR